MSIKHEQEIKELKDRVSALEQVVAQIQYILDGQTKQRETLKVNKAK